MSTRRPRCRYCLTEKNVLSIFIPWILSKNLCLLNALILIYFAYLIWTRFLILHRLLSEGRKGQADASRKSRPESELVSKEIYESTKSSLEAELREIRERYSDMSLKYAQVESQREELVMKLKTAKTVKRWFSWIHIVFFSLDSKVIF